MQGTLGDINFYKSQDGYLIREKGGVSGKRIKKDPVFQRSRENAMEFGRAARAGKLLRMAVRPLLLNSDNRVVSRLHGQMMKVLHADMSSARGQRNVVDGDLGLLTDFEFNSRSPLGSTFYAPYSGTIDRMSGTLTLEIPAYVPTEMIMAPDGATHYKIISGGAELDFVNRTFVVDTNESAVLPWNGLPTVALNHSHQVTAASTHPLFLVLCLAFYQEVNGEMYALQDGSYNSSAVVKVSKV
ncbi:hypothetical protein [Flavobacterium sp.]|uniref:hypothetical protein n=1 Tax=Flavobacterium sp. TaxID=239 RepID=UPI00391A762F